MNPSQFWKNFQLGEELDIAGMFIYDGLRRFHELQNLDFDDELFGFLYEIAIGLERLLKIAITLYEHTESTKQNEFEKSLITHNHPKLMERLRKHVVLNFGKQHNDLLNMLGNFYNSSRYKRLL